MGVRIFITRRVPKEVEEEIRPLVIQLRSRANAQSGYISGETLVNFDDPAEHLVISTWKSVEDWNAWKNNPKRAELQSQVDAILGSETLYQVYYNG